MIEYPTVAVFFCVCFCVCYCVCISSPIVSSNNPRAECNPTKPSIYQSEIPYIRFKLPGFMLHARAFALDAGASAIPVVPPHMLSDRADDLIIPVLIRWKNFPFTIYKIRLWVKNYNARNSPNESDQGWSQRAKQDRSGL